ncbi:2-succinyl-5-enolpyruvyl-6-hydroxy-3-cyclohexene-1-carboxylic-acid synthase [Leptolyngbya sp. GB1-A1]|uniref:2-succinyl-5-enolpyruvyl-6-hydroxy-3- cyclohexene-1-carboxylic-acid synthase n=2 Tax=Leptolyngbya TaxID=47251 RepID=UPI0019CAB743|nr:2-succinyl-5-enolpyruvyl-6-hydroxy-3-cyclohexene-1-carboxylic-acid synthase [Cyanobacteria bacterium FACHB-502]
MPINFSNTNSVWASVLVETLHCLGLQTAVICPGSRSAPLTVAFALHKAIEAIPVLDERSAAFFALGLAKQTGRAVALVCTSGTAGANFYPAVIEARESRVPLIILTSDRPPELRECNAGQTIDQQKLYGTYPNWYSELSIPGLELSLLAYLRQTIVYAWERAHQPVAGCVHLNLPFRDPLAPIPQAEAKALGDRFPTDFFRGIAPAPFVQFEAQFAVPSLWQQSDYPEAGTAPHRGLIIAGVAQPGDRQTYCESIARLSQSLGVPVLAEGLSPVRNAADLNPNLITTYDLILRNSDWADKLQPDWVIRVGEMPTSKTLRQWLNSDPLLMQWIIDPDDRNLDPLHLRTVHLRLSIEQVAAQMTRRTGSPSHYLKSWLEMETIARQKRDRTLAQTDFLFEGKVSWLLSQHLPPGTPLFIANSMPVRDIEWFWQPGNRQIQPCFNRGANGIDGTLSAAIGTAHRQPSSVLLTGDLALLHDTNGFLLRNKLQGHLTIVLINNNGGGIFEMLPIAQFEPPFEDFFATPQDIDFAQLCATYGVDYHRIRDWQGLIDRIQTLPQEGIRLLEVQTDRKRDTIYRRQILNQLQSA